MMVRLRFGHRSWGLLLLVLFCVPAGGCKKRAASVSGKVTFEDGQPVPFGTVLFANDRFKGEAKIQGDGSYRMNDVPPGEVAVAVFLARPAPPPTLGGRGGPRKSAGPPAMMPPGGGGRGGGPPPTMPGMLPGMRVGKDKMAGPGGKEGMPEGPDGMPPGLSGRPGTPGMPPGMMPGERSPLLEMIPAELKEKMEKLDVKYNNLSKSGLRYTVTRSSEQTFDITLTP